MKAKVYETRIYEIVGNTDSTEGRGQRLCLGFYYDGTTAREEARGRGVFGTDARVEDQLRRIVEVDGEKFLLGPRIIVGDMRERIRERALAKLTPDELIALGLAARTPSIVIESAPGDLCGGSGRIGGQPCPGCRACS